MKYQITYQNGFKQILNLIDTETYETIVGLKDRIYSIECMNSTKLPKKARELAIFKLKQKISNLIGDFSKCFIENSPIYNAIETGELKLHKNQGGVHIIKIIKL